MKKSLFRLLAMLWLAAFAVTSQAAVKVLASLHPLGLVAASVTPVEDLAVLVPDGMTPHDFSLRPSDIGKLQTADIIFWAGPVAEPYLQEFKQRWPDKQWLDISAFAPAEEHGHEHEEHGHGEDGHGDVHHDPHWWLAPDVMIRAQAALASALNKDAGPFAENVQAQLKQSHARLAPYKDKGFFVFHRAYDHWVEAMELNQVGAFTLSPERKPGLKTLQVMRGQLLDGSVTCVFSEPEFSPALVDSVVRGLDIKRAELDPMAIAIPLSKDGYVQYLRYLTTQFESCLS